MAPSTSSIPSEPLPFAADTLYHTHWRRHQSLASTPYPSSHPDQTFESFLAAAIARDTACGIATKPIAPSIISELSTSHKRLIRRYRRLWWIILVLVQASSLSSVTAMVFLIQDAVRERGARPTYLIWFLLSLTTFAGTVAGLVVVWMARRRRRRWERERRDGEVEKWKREARRMGMEMWVLRGQAGRLGRSLRDVSRGFSRVGTARSVSRGRRRRRVEAYEGWDGEEVDRGRIWDGVSCGNAGQEGNDVTNAGNTKDLPPLPKKDSLTVHTITISGTTGPNAIHGPSFPSPAILPHPTMRDLAQYRNTEIQRCSIPELTHALPWTRHLDQEAGPRSNPEANRKSTRTTHLDLERSDRNNVRNNYPRRSNLEPKRISTWTYHLDLEADDDIGDNERYHKNHAHNDHNYNNPTNDPITTTQKPTPSSHPPHHSPPFSFPSFPSFHFHSSQTIPRPHPDPSNLNPSTPTPSTLSDANFLAANIAASDAVSDSSIVAALRRERSREKVGAWRDGWVGSSSPLGEGGKGKERGEGKGKGKGSGEGNRRWGFGWG